MRTSDALIRLLTPYHVAGFTLERWGSVNDGGYVVPVELMRKATVLVSGGVENNVDFERDVAAHIPGIRIGMFDHSIAKLPEDAPSEAQWHQRELGSRPGCTTLEEAATLSGARPRDRLILKLDVEDAEWELLENTPRDFWQRVNVLIIEYHWMHRRERWKAFRSALEKLTGIMLPIHVHANNHDTTVHFRHQGVHFPITLEVTYINRSLIPAGSTPEVWRQGGPTSLDAPNKVGLPDQAFDYWIPRKWVFLRRLRKNLRKMFTKH